MKVLTALIFAAVAVAVTARHRKEWQRVDPMKVHRERLLPIYKSSTPVCTKGAGFYRDPQNCHQFIRCVDEFNTGRYFHIFVGRCEPGLVFDENISACNWPELTAPCSNSPEKLQETQKPLEPEKVAQVNVISEERDQEKPYPVQQEIQRPQDSDYHDSQQHQTSWQQQQQVIQAPQDTISYEIQQQEVPWQQQQIIQHPQDSGFYDPHQQEISYQQHVVHEILVEGQKPSYQDPITQVEEDTQRFDEKGPHHVFQENAQVSINQQQHFEQEQAIQEPIQKEINPTSDFFQRHLNSQQQQVSYEEPIQGNDQVKEAVFQQQKPSSGFQQTVDEENKQFEISTNDRQGQIQQETQSQWWIPENKPQHHPPGLAEQIPESDLSNDAILCSHEGFYRHPENCSQFIRCVKIERGAYAVHFFECPKQLVFNEKDSACVVADMNSCKTNLRKKRQASSSKLQCRSEGFFRHPEDCRSFYRCVKTETGSYETHLFSCPANLVFDEEYTTCNWPEKAPPCNAPAQQVRRKPAQSERKTTYKPPTRTTPKPRNDFIDKSITQETYGRRRSTEKPRYTTRSYTENAPKCRSQGFFENKNDCTKFFKCVKKGNNYIRYDLSCPNNFAFDDRSKRCIAQRYVASCNKNKPPYPPRQDDEETTLSPEASSTQSSSASPSDSTNDGIVCEKEGYFRHPQDCNKFYRCVDFSGEGQEFVRYDFNCPEGLVFDEANSVCNWPDPNSPCDVRSSNEGGNEGDEGTGEENGTGGNEGPTEEDGAGGSEVTEENEIESEEGGDRDGDENQDNPSSASDDKSIETTSSSSVNEGNEQGETGSETESSGSENECTKEGYYRNPDDCNKFYRCVDFSGEGKEFVRYDFSCPDGLVFDEVNSVCNWPSESEPCDTRSGGGNENDGNGGGQDTTTSSTSDGQGESSEDNGNNLEDDQNTPDPSTSSQGSSEGSTPSQSSSTSGLETDATESPTRSPGGSTSDSRGSNGDRNSGECTEEGFFRNPEDCNKFYRCVDHTGDGQEFVKYDFTCPEGLVFDESNSVCNWPDQSAPCDNGSPGGGQGTTDEGDGSESSQTSSDSGESSSGNTTPSDNESSSEQTTAAYSSTQSTTNADGRGSETTESGESQSSTTERSVDTSSSDNGNTTDSSSGDSGQNQGECTEEGFFRNPDDCGKFYRCVDFNGDGQQFVRYDFDCPDGLVFDEVNSVCNWPDQSPACETGGSAPERETTTSDERSSQTEAPSSTEQPTQSSTEQTTQRSTEQSTQTSTGASSSENPTSGDSSECSEPGFYRCQDDCSKFYRCVDENGRLVRYDFKCPDGLIFDDQNKKCDWPSSQLTCDTDSSTSTGTTSGRSTTSTYESSTTTESTSQSDSTTQSSTSRSTSTTASTTSSNIECTEEGFFRHPDDCSKYYRCLDEGDGTFTREDYACAEDEVFDEEMRYCNRKDLAPPCDDSQTTSSQSQTTSASQSQTTASESSSYETQSTTQRTTPSQTSTESSTKSSESSECTQPGFFRCPEDCTKFYRCAEQNDGNLVRYDFQCPDGLIFDERNNKCDWPSSDLTCDTDSSSTSDSQTSGTTSSDSSDTTSTSSERASSSGTTSSTESSSTDGCTEEGFFRNPEDCSKYYRCIDEGDGTLTREDYACAEDEVFDEEMRYCNRKDLAPPCDNTSSSTTEGSRESTTQAGSRESTTQAGSTESTTQAGSSESTTEAGSSESTTQESSSESSSQPSSEQGPERTTTSSTSGSGECQEEGFHRDPNDCSKFYRCVDFRGDGQSFTRYDFDCPEGLVFDETNDVCNWPSSVPSCESSGGSSDTPGSGSSTTSGDTDSSRSTDNESSTATTSGEQTTSTASGEQTSPTREDEKSSTATEDQSSSTLGDGSDSSVSSTTSSSNDDSTTSGGSTTASSSTSSGDTSTRGSSSDIECTEEGFFRHPEDCNKFYRCVDFAGTGESFVRYDFDCPEGLVFDEVNSVCNWPNQSPSCESGSRGGNGDVESSNTGDSSTTNSQSTSESTTSGSTDNAATSQNSDSTTSRDQTTTSSSQSSAATSSASDEFSCEDEGYFKHPSDCKKYYECKRDEDTGELVRIDCECPDGQVWDNEGWYCNAEELSPPCESSSSSFKCREEGFFRDPEDCTKYYQCNRTGPGENDFQSEQFQCEDGLVFDESGRYCNAPELSEPCNGSTSGSTTSGDSSSTSTSTTSGDSSSTSTSTTSGDSSSTSSSTTSGDSSSTSSSDTSDAQRECTREGFFRDPEDCTKYYQCTRNENTGEFDRNDHTCPDGRIFDEGSNYCNDPELSEQPCETGSDGGITSTTSQQTTNTEPSGESGSSSPATGARSSGGDPQCTEEGFFRHPDDCNKFYRCVDFSGSGESFVRYDFDCPEGLHFDEVNSVCNWPTMTPPCQSSNRLFNRVLGIIN